MKVEDCGGETVDANDESSILTGPLTMLLYFLVGVVFLLLWENWLLVQMFKLSFGTEINKSSLSHLCHSADKVDSASAKVR